MICIRCGKEVADGAYCLACGARQDVKKPAPRKRGNGQGTVIRRGKTYTAIATVGGYVDADMKYHPIRRSKGGFKTKKAAYEYIPVLQQRPERRTLFSALWAAYVAGPYKKLSASKQASYDTAARRLAPVMNRDIQDVGLQELQELVNEAAPTYYLAKEMKNVLSHLYGVAIANQDMTVNLSRFLSLPPLEAKEPEAYSQEEVDAMWKSWEAGNKDLSYALLMIYTGTMPGELMRMTVSMIDRREREISGCGLKTKKRRETPIVYPPLLDPVIDALCASAGPDGRLASMCMATFRTRHRAALEAAGVRVLRPYACRHTTATALAAAKVAPVLIQEAMRHSSFSTTERYIHLKPEDAHAAVAVLKGEIGA